MRDKQQQPVTDRLELPKDLECYSQDQAQKDIMMGRDSLNTCESQSLQDQNESLQVHKSVHQEEKGLEETRTVQTQMENQDKDLRKVADNLSK